MFRLSQLACSGVLRLESESITRLYLLLLSFIKYSTSRDGFVDSRLRVLRVIASLVPLVSDCSVGIPTLCALLAPGKTCVSDIVVRKEVLAVLDAMKQRIPSMSQVVFLSNAHDCKVTAVLFDLHATSSSSIGAYNFAKRGDAYELLIRQRLASFGPKESSFQPLLASVLHDLCDSDMMIRTSSLRALTDFVQDAHAMIRNGDEAMERVLSEGMIPSIRFVFQSNFGETTRRSAMQLFRQILLASKDFGSPVFGSDLLALVNASDEDADVLLGLLHLQTRRKVKSMRSICQLAQRIREGKSPRLAAVSIRTVLLPLLFACIRENPKNAGAC